MYRRLALSSLALVAIAGLSACNTQGDLERGLVGAGVGCVAGEVLLDDRCAEGAIAGGAAGVLSNRL